MNVTIFKEEASCINRCNFLLERSIRHVNGRGTMKQRLERTILVHTLPCHRRQAPLKCFQVRAGAREVQPQPGWRSPEISGTCGMLVPGLLGELPPPRWHPCAGCATPREVEFSLESSGAERDASATLSTELRPPTHRGTLGEGKFKA